MADWTNIEGTCQRYYNLGDRKPTQSQRNNITQLCRRGEFKRATKVGREWLVDWDEEGAKDGD